MNKLTIIGNLTRDPETRTTQTGKEVCSFTVAVNRRKTGNQQPEADFFRVTAWENLAKICQQYLAKGRKVVVVGPVSLHTYTTQDGKSGSSLEVRADDVEFLSPKGDQGEQQAPAQVDQQTGFQQVDTDELPF
jgi:single-strand DNA-binding protein